MSALAKVWVAALGGTIAMAGEPDRGLHPSISGNELISAIPEIAARADVHVVTLSSKPSASLTLEEVLDVGVRAQEAIDAGSAGAVIVQGTDSLEETAYLLDLYWTRDEPLVVTGAMRAGGQPGADGSANLLAAVTSAADQGARGLGVLVVLADEVHAARHVAKSDTSLLHAFRSTPFGPLGRVVEGRVVIGTRAGPRRPVDVPLRLDVRVGLLHATLGDSDLALLAGVEPAGLDGVVLAGFGAGHVPAPAVPALQDLASRLPVVLASRTGSGPVLESTYGFPGSERDLLERGLISARWLPPPKARLLLWALLAADVPTTHLPAEFALRS